MNFFKARSFQILFFSIGLLVALFSASLNSKTAAQGTEGLCSGANLDLSGSTKDCSKNEAGESCKDANNQPIACSDKTLNNLIAQIINIFSIIVGVIAVIMIIYSGFRYITSGGDSSKIEESKKTLIYAIVGLIIVALAQFIVKFVLEKSANSIS